jgi:hypothetical protein
MSNLGYFIGCASEFVIPDQLQELAHTRAYSRATYDAKQYMTLFFLVSCSILLYHIKNVIMKK